MRRRATLTAALAGALLLATTGCTFVAEIATLEEYDPSDGVGTTIGDVQVRNMLAITEDGQRAALIFAATNSGDENVRLNVSLTEGGTGEQVRIPAGQFTSVGAGGEQLVFEGLDVTPGSLLPVYVQYGDEPGRLLNVPVLDAGLAEYAALVPSPTPTPEPEPVVPPEETAPPADPDATADPNATAEPGVPAEEAPTEPAPGEDEGAEQPPTDG
ncbi:hypothetical protein ACFFGH_23870 [Lysobacter korlensis]|uniref:DNA modification methylase n=1 Tax=Lysobacter korlensis TaxID=553636 RepID=A0ABV6RV79_9GAMM